MENKVHLGNLVNIKTGKLDANAAVENGKYPFFTTAKEISRIDTYSYDDEVVLVAGNGDLNVKYYSGKFDAYQRTYILTKQKNREVSLKYIYYFLESYLDTLRYQSIGGVIKYIKLANLTDAKLLLPPLPTQHYIATIFDHATALIEKRKAQIAELDKLVKAVFLEMFGDPILSTCQEKLGNIFEIIDGDRGKSYPKNEDFSDSGYCLFLNTKNVTKIGFNFRNSQFISKEKDESLRKGRLIRNDIVLTTRGTVGNIAYYSNEVPYSKVRINSGMVILRAKKEINVDYFTSLVRYFNVFENYISGSAQPQLPISILKEIEINLPDINFQTLFAEKVCKIQAEKDRLQRSLVEMEQYLQSLMAKFFG